MSEPATAGRWTTEPPTVAGTEFVRYWWRAAPLERPQPVNVYPNMPPACHYGEWWTIPIQEPPR